jgi:hypothetical protein
MSGKTAAAAKTFRESPPHATGPQRAAPHDVAKPPASPAPRTIPNASAFRARRSDRQTAKESAACEAILVEIERRSQLSSIAEQLRELRAFAASRAIRRDIRDAAMTVHVLAVELGLPLQTMASVEAAVRYLSPTARRASAETR